MSSITFDPFASFCALCSPEAIPLRYTRPNFEAAVTALAIRGLRDPTRCLNYRQHFDPLSCRRFLSSASSTITPSASRSQELGNMELHNRPSEILEIGKCVTLLHRALLCSRMKSISTSPDWIAMFNISVGLSIKPEPTCLGLWGLPEGHSVEDSR